MSRPSFSAAWKNFPDHIDYPTLKDLYEHLGGNAERNIYQPGFGPQGNTCASRMSVALNAAGAPIQPALVPVNKRLSTKNGQHIIFNVTALRQYLFATLGKPQLDTTRPFDDSFKRKKGIVAFGVNWDGATGHIALFDGMTYREPRHDSFGSYVAPRTAGAREVATYRGEFWELLP